MSTITKQWLQQKIADMEAARDEIPFGLGEDDSNTLAALRIALASLEAEAVGEVVLGEYDDCGCHPDARVVCIAADGQADWENFKDGTRLYAAPPSLVEIDEREAFNAWNNDENLPIAGVGAKNAAWLAWQARAAMLQGSQPVSSHDELLPSIKPAPELDFVAKNANLLPSKYPVIPDGWIACSERMPEDAQWCAVSTEYGYYVQCWSHGQGWLGDDISIPNCDVTHWMPLPAAPQQEAKNV